MKKSSKTKALIAVLSVFAISSAGAVGAACSNKTVGYIDAPETLQEELGTYVVPEYEVVDKRTNRATALSSTRARLPWKKRAYISLYTPQTARA